MPSRGNKPDPDELLARISSEEDQKARGKLKIFLGYIAGVGKHIPCWKLPASGKGSRTSL
jgi:K+-sensing histidine kinase KdpD